MELEQYKSSAFEIFDRLLRAMRSPEGYVHPQSLLCCIGSLAGYSCQHDVRKLFMTEGVKEDDVFTVFTDKSGRKYFYGDIIDEKLVGNNYSVWSFTAGVLQKYNEPFTDVGEMLRYTAANAGGASFVSRQGRASHSFRTLHTKSHDDLQKRSVAFGVCKNNNGKRLDRCKGGLQGLVR